MVVTLLVAATVLALLHLYFFAGKAGRIDYVYLLVLLIVMGLNSYNVDYTAYEHMYRGACDATTLGEAMRVHQDRGYMLLNFLFSVTGLDFAIFRFILFSSLLVVVFVLARLLDAPICVLYIAYMIYPMFMDIIQIRNFIISIIFLFSIYCYAHDNFKWDVLGILLMLIAVTIQPLALVYLLFIVFYKMYNSERFRKVTYIPIGVGLLSLLIKLLIDAYWKEITELLYQLASAVSRGGGYVNDLLLTSIQLKIFLVVIILTWMLYKAKIRLAAMDCVTDLQKRFVDLSFTAYVYMICWTPFFALNHNLATRLPRNLFLLAFISLAIYMQKCTNGRKKWGMLIFVVFLAFFFGLVDLYMSHQRFNLDIIIDNNFLLN